MENQISVPWYMILIKGIIMILLALLILSSPGGDMLALGIWLGLGLIIAGIVVIIKGIALSKINGSNWGWGILEGCIDILFGVVLMANPVMTAELIPFMIGLWAAFYGIYLIIDGIVEVGNRMVKIAAGILIIVFSSIIMYSPMLTGMTLALWIGITLMIVGIYNVFISFSLK